MGDASSGGGWLSAGEKPGTSRFWALALGSIGVVFGDIGTSPLYAFKESIHHISEARDGALMREDVLGVISLMMWSLIIIVTLKYVLLLLRLDNRGEGGTLSLDGAGAADDRAAHAAVVRRGGVQRGHVLRRCAADARRVGALGGRGPDGHPRARRGASSPSSCRSRWLC